MNLAISPARGFPKRRKAREEAGEGGRGGEYEGGERKGSQWPEQKKGTGTKGREREEGELQGSDGGHRGSANTGRAVRREHGKTEGGTGGVRRCRGIAIREERAVTVHSRPSIAYPQGRWYNYPSEDRETGEHDNAGRGIRKDGRDTRQRAGPYSDE